MAMAWNRGKSSFERMIEHEKSRLGTYWPIDYHHLGKMLKSLSIRQGEFVIDDYKIESIRNPYPIFVGMKKKCQMNVETKKRIEEFAKKHNLVVEYSLNRLTAWFKDSSRETLGLIDKEYFAARNGESFENMGKEIHGLKTELDRTENNNKRKSAYEKIAGIFGR